MMEVLQLNHAQVLSLLPDRDPWGHKGNFGKILLLCGSRGYTGAAYLAAMGALRTGAGLVFLGVPESIYAIEAVKLHEPVVFPLPDREGKLSREALGEILERLPQMDSGTGWLRPGAVGGYRRCGRGSAGTGPMPGGGGCRWHKRSGAA